MRKEKSESSDSTGIIKMENNRRRAHPNACAPASFPTLNTKKTNDYIQMKSVIIGAGTYGTVYLSYLQEAGIDVRGFLDDNEQAWGTEVAGVAVWGGTGLLPVLKSRYGIEAVYCPIGNNRLRADFLSRAKAAGLSTPNYIHPSVVLSPHVRIGEGVYILLGTTVMPYVTIDDYVMISMGVHLAHHSVLSRGVFLSTGVNFGASIQAQENAYIGISATIMTGIRTVGKDSLVGAGAVVIKDVPERAVVAGVPAKIIRYQE